MKFMISNVLKVSLLIAIFFSAESFSAFRLTTYNIRNFDNDYKAGPTNKSALVYTLRNLRADLIALQEVNNKEEMQRLVKLYLPGYGLVLSKCGGYFKQHLGFLYKKDSLRLVRFTEDARLASRNASEPPACPGSLRPAGIGLFQMRNGDHLLAMSVHLKAGGKQKDADTRMFQYQTLTKMIYEYRSRGYKNIAIMGDFNTTDYTLRNNNYKRFISFLRYNNLVDFSQNVGCTSYWSGGKDDGINYPSLLDHVLLTGPILRQIKHSRTYQTTHCQIVRCQKATDKQLGVTYKSVSDHCPVVTDIK